MSEYRTPGVYIEEVPHLPPSIVAVETAIPVFIGYTEIAIKNTPDDLIGTYWRITSPLDYKTYYGGAPVEPTGALTVSFDDINGTTATVEETKRSPYLLFYSLQLFFANGGGPCYIYSVGKYASADPVIDYDLQNNALAEIAKEAEITLIVFPDSMSMTDGDKYYELHQNARAQCEAMRSRFVAMDVFRSRDKTTKKLNKWQDDVNIFKGQGPAPAAGQKPPLSMADPNVNLESYVGAYFPRLVSLVTYNYADANVAIKATGQAAKDIPSSSKTLDALKAKNNSYYNLATQALDSLEMLLPTATAAVGVYAQVDTSRGVWKAPANVNIANVVAPEVIIADVDQDTLNVDQIGGLSINVIRYFTGRGNAIIWGARTLAGNDNEWRYISVRRFFIMVEQSVKNATQQFVFEPNDENTWVRIKSMITNFLTQQWKFGALMGSSVKEAFFVHIGLGQTMTELDIWEGRLIIQIGMAAVRPAEFIVLQFMHKMLSES
jgi:phage tail sheath protein FI